LTPTDFDVVIVGGGITGLAAANFLAANSSASIALFESEPTLGGKIRTERIGNVIVEAGADSFLARTPEAVRLAQSVGLAEELVSPDVFGALIATGRGLTPLPGGSVYGIPGSVRALARAKALTPAGRLRALAEMLSVGKHRDPDTSVGEFIGRRFGRQVLDRLVDPLLAGTRAGEVKDMSLAAALPQVDALARKHRSLLLGIGSERRRGQIESGSPPFLTIQSGMHRLVEALERRLASRVEFHLGSAVQSIHSDGARVVIEGQQTTHAKSVVFTAPAFAAGAALRSLDADAAALLARTEYASAASVALVYPPGGVVTPPGFSGILVPKGAAQTISALTFYSQKWTHATTDASVLRCFVGRAGRHPALDLPDVALVDEVAADVRALCRVSGEPTASNVVRWERSLPQYSVGHLQRLDEAERLLAARAPVFPAGAGYRGSGIPDCIKQGEAAAKRVVSLFKGG
jgi:oxygen-dependent protoporphyrinogen oxidase